MSTRDRRRQVRAKRGQQVVAAAVLAALVTTAAGCGGDDETDDSGPEPVSELTKSPLATADCGDEGVLFLPSSFSLSDSPPEFLDWGAEEILDLENVVSDAVDVPDDPDFAIACVPTDDGAVRLVEVAAAVDLAGLDENDDAAMEQLGEDRPASWVALDESGDVLWTEEFDDHASSVSAAYGVLRLEFDDVTTIRDARTGEEIAGEQQEVSYLHPVSPTSYIDGDRLVSAADDETMASLSGGQAVPGTSWVIGRTYVDGRYQLTLLDGITGDVIWQIEQDITIDRMRDLFYDATTGVVMWSSDDELRALDVETGEVRWSRDDAVPATGYPVRAGGGVITFHDPELPGEVYLDTATGEDIDVPEGTQLLVLAAGGLVVEPDGEDSEVATRDDLD